MLRGRALAERRRGSESYCTMSGVSVLAALQRERSGISGHHGQSSLQPSVYHTGFKEINCKRTFLLRVSKMIESFCLPIHGVQEPLGNPFFSLWSLHGLWQPLTKGQEGRRASVCSSWPHEHSPAFMSGLWWRKRNWSLLPFPGLWFFLALSAFLTPQELVWMSWNHAL